jgi:acetylglutamate kinase
MLVIKYGGHSQDHGDTSDPIIATLAAAHKAGEKIVLIHGGAPAINRELSFHGVSAPMVGGYRATTPEVFEVVQRTLSGEVLRNIVNQFISHGVNAVGLSSGDGRTVRAIKKTQTHDGAQIDLGLVGEVENVDPTFLHLLLEKGYFPIISPVGVSTHGDGLNINGDSVVGAIGGALKAHQVIFLTDVDGIYSSWPDKSSLIDEISVSDLENMLHQFSEGMIPKALSAIAAIKAGATLVRICNATAVDNALAGIGGTVVSP